MSHFMIILSTIYQFIKPFLGKKMSIFEEYGAFRKESLEYSWLSLSRPRLSRITAYFEAKIWPLPKHENLTTGKKILWKRGEIAPKEQFLLFSTIFSIYARISNSKSQITYIFVKFGCSNYFFFNSADLICRGTDISKYFIESLGFRDNESRLYLAIILA